MHMALVLGPSNHLFVFDFINKKQHVIRILFPIPCPEINTYTLANISRDPQGSKLPSLQSSVTVRPSAIDIDHCAADRTATLCPCTLTLLTPRPHDWY